jgi:WD40 repeat protein
MKTIKIIANIAICLTFFFISGNKSVLANKPIDGFQTQKESNSLLSVTPSPTPTTSPILSIPTEESGKIFYSPSEPIDIKNVSKITKIGQFLKSPVISIRFLPQHKIMVVGTSSGLYFYDANTYEEKNFYYFPHLVSLEVSDESNFIALGSYYYDKKVVILRYPELEIIKSFSSNIPESDNNLSSPITGSFSKDGKFFTVSEKQTRIFKTEDWSETIALKTERQNDTFSTFSPDGSYLVTYGRNFLNIWKLPEGKWVATISDQSEFKSANFSPDSSFLVTGTSSNVVRVINPKGGGIIRSLFQHTGSVNSIQFSYDGKYLLTGSNDKNACLWNSENWSLVHTFKHISPVRAVSFTQDGSTVITASSVDKNQSQNLLFWDVGSFTLKQRITGFLKPSYGQNAFTRAVAFSPDNALLATLSDDKFARIWRLSDGKQINQLSVESRDSIAFSPNGKTLAVGNLIFTLPDGKIQIKLPFEVNDGCFSKKGDIYATRSRNGNNTVINVWNVIENKRIYSKSVPGSGFSIDISNNGEMIAVDLYDQGSAEYMINVSFLDTKIGKVLNRIHKHGGTGSFIFDSSDTSIFIGYWGSLAERVMMNDTRLVVYEGRKDQQITHTNGQLAVSNNNNILINGPDILSLVSGKMIGTLPLDYKTITGVFISNDSKYLATSTDAGEVFIWGIKSD